MFYHQFLNLRTPSKQTFLDAPHPDVFTPPLFVLACAVLLSQVGLLCE